MLFKSFNRRIAWGIGMAVVMGAALSRNAGADVVAEMSFQTAAANGSGAAVAMDRHVASASGQLKLLGDGSRITEIKAEETGLGKAWAAKAPKGLPVCGSIQQRPGA